MKLLHLKPASLAKATRGAPMPLVSAFSSQATLLRLPLTQKLVPSSGFRLLTTSSAVRADAARTDYPGRPKAPIVADYSPEELANRNDSARLLRFCDNVRRHGHRAARIDPLGLMEREDAVAALDPARYGFKSSTSSTLQSPQDANLPSHEVKNGDDHHDIRGIIAFPDGRAKASTAEVVEHLRRTYVDDIAFEFMHSPFKGLRSWWIDYLETAAVDPVSAEEASRIHSLLTGSEELDRFLAKRFPHVKRYGGEGAESLMVVMDALVQGAVEAKMSDVIISSPHRGRLSMLTSPVLQLELPTLFHALQGRAPLNSPEGMTHDVISHLTSVAHHGDTRVELLPNPSHLEAVGPLAAGYARAKGNKSLNITLHGDAAFTGQGVVAETMCLSELPDFSCAGTIHVVVNNNIGYTTPSSLGRSSMYASDIAKLLGSPIIHVNGDSPESCARAARAAQAFRTQWQRDVVIDLIVYRRWGHNELDEPGFTQPSMYKAIRSRRSVPESYETTLKDRTLLSEEKMLAVREAHREKLASELASTEAGNVPQRALPFEEPGSSWSEHNITWPSSSSTDSVETGISTEKLKDVGQRSVLAPEGFNLHPTLLRHIKQRLASLESGTGVNWATAEALAWGSLMDEGYSVRISGQDVARGTFSERHAAFVDQATEQAHVPLNATASASGGQLELCNSSLSELAVLAFEQGQAWARPDLLPIFAAQFADFINQAQVTIDTLISGALAKWGRQSAMLLLLPHGYDGAGPEHSSARLERFLQLCNDPLEMEHEPYVTNLQVAFPSTPAQYFHLLRRQMHRPCRLPLVVASPKGLLRAPHASSSLSDMSVGTSFQPIIVDAATSSTEHITLCSGKHYYLLRSEVDARKLADRVTLVRIEELSPFPFAPLREALEPLLASAQSITFAQEEPQNQGVLTFVAPRIASVLKSLDSDATLKLCSRKPSANVATGVAEMHKAEVKQLLEEVFEGL